MIVCNDRGWEANLRSTEQEKISWSWKIPYYSDCRKWNYDEKGQAIGAASLRGATVSSSNYNTRYSNHQRLKFRGALLMSFPATVN